MAMPDYPDRQWIRSSVLCFSLSLFTILPAFAQVGSHAADEPVTRLRRPAAPAYDLVALRVEFQPDSSRFSTGDGVFGGNLFEGLEPRVDPFPHDAAYFEAHLAFLTNYVTKVSNGQTSVQTHMVPEIVRVSGRMGDYAPIGPDADSPEQREKLLALVREAWNLADSQSAFDASSLDPSNTAFVLFHAGTGRDIELTGTVLDRTPEDLPSLYFASADLAGSDPPIRFKNLDVSNTALIPETESKRGVDPITSEPFLLELSINGLLAASFFNFLGVPDLFDVSDGSSAIGPYGLMDPLGIFAYNGILPPEPSGWTRYFLGWTTPLVLAGPEPQDVTLEAGVGQVITPISSSEYFLAEVRHRDPAGDGLNLKVWRDGEIVDQRFDADTDGFNGFDQSGFEGVLVDADDFDWVLPGGFDDTGALREGGILIWHVDERVISEGLAANRVNTNPSQRGLDLEEADSAQDIGFPSTNPFAPEFDRGTPFDFYFDGNPVTSITATGEVTLYANRFGPDTYPNSNSNGGGASFVVLDNFGPTAPSMSLSYRRESGTITPIDFETRQLDGNSGTGSSLIGLRMDPNQELDDALIYHSGAETQTLWMVPIKDGLPTKVQGVLSKPVVYTSSEGVNDVAFLRVDDTDEVSMVVSDKSLEETRRVVALPSEVRLATPSTHLVGMAKSTGVDFYVGYDLGDQGYVVTISGNGSANLTPFAGGGVVALAVTADNKLFVAGRDRAQVWDDGSVSQDWMYGVELAGARGVAVVGRDGQGILAAVTAIGESKMVVLGSDSRVTEIELPTPPAGLPVLTDTDRDGFLDVVVASGSMLQSFSREGAVSSGFPFKLPAEVATQPTTARFSGVDETIMMVSAADGYLYAFRFTERPQLIDGFPLAIGSKAPSTPLVSGHNIYSVSADGVLAGWEVTDLGQSEWSTLYGNKLNQSVIDLGDTLPGVVSESLIIGAETYNWPNPIRQGVTQLRVATAEPCALDITIIDMAGNLVHSVQADIRTAWVPVEFEWRPAVSSGVYFARVTATTDSGTEDVRLYSIAVIK